METDIYRRNKSKECRSLLSRCKVSTKKLRVQEGLHKIGKLETGMEPWMDEGGRGCVWRKKRRKKLFGQIIEYLHLQLPSPRLGISTGR